MASGTYNTYNYPYQQSSAQQYTAYQTAPVSNNASTSSRQYQTGTTQSTDYMSYQPQSYSAYGGNQGHGAATGNNYGGNRESTSRAAAVLHNMSNTNYRSSSQPGFTATNATTASRYADNTPHTQQAQPLTQSYAQQAQPRNVTANRSQGSSSTRSLPPPPMATGPPARRTETANLAQQYGQAYQTPSSAARTTGLTAATNHSDHNQRQLPNPNTSVSVPYSYGDTQATAPASQPTASSETYNQGAITVDPMAVYDPWPVYQRKQEALRAQQVIEDAARAESDRIAEEARIEQEKKDEERKRREAADMASKADSSQGQQNRRKSQPGPSIEPESTGSTSDASMGGAMEEQIRALMAKMREFNSKDPALLARIWEEERRAKAPKSPTVQTTSVANPPASVSNPSPMLNPPPHSKPNEAPMANQRRKAAPVRAPSAKPVTPAPVPTKAPAPVVQVRHGGKTIWPPEKKSQLAAAASSYISAQNPTRSLEGSDILVMLDTNPSYIELCEELESMGLKLDRAQFAKTLLTAVPDVNSASRAKTTQSPSAGAANSSPAPTALVAPPAVMKRNTAAPATPAAGYASVPTPSSHPTPAAVNTSRPVPVAEMIPIKRDLKTPANKEEAARKRTFEDLIGLTQLPDDEEFEPPPKKVNTGPMYSFASSGPAVHDAMNTNDVFTPNSPPVRSAPQSLPESRQPPPNELRTTVVEPLDRRKALRRNKYNIKTIARDVLLACGRHPDTRQLNQHLEMLKQSLPQITNDADLSTLRWDIIDPGRPPPGYFKASVEALAEDANDENDSDIEESLARQSSAQGLGQSTGPKKAQALPEAINPFKQKRRGRPPRQSLPTDPTVSTPDRPGPKLMSASAPRPTVPAANVGYAAFRSATAYDADGKPLPKKKGRPVGWRKAIHGSAAAQTRSPANGRNGPLPSQPSTLRNVYGDQNSPVQIDSPSTSVSNPAPRYQSYKCKWQNCTAELHNLETLKKHVQKVHIKDNIERAVECLWDGCATQRAMNSAADRLEHLEQAHFSPLSWQLGDGPASGLSDTNDSEAYLSDAQGRRVTPRITARPEYLKSNSLDTTIRSNSSQPLSGPRGRGRPPKRTPDQQATEEHDRYMNQKKRIGGPGMDRGGATLVNEKRRKGFSDNDDTEEELVDAED